MPLFGRKPTQRTEARDFYWKRQKQTARQQRADQARRQAHAEA